MRLSQSAFSARVAGAPCDNGLTKKYNNTLLIAIFNISERPVYHFIICLNMQDDISKLRGMGERTFHSSFIDWDCLPPLEIRDLSRDLKTKLQARGIRFEELGKPELVHLPWRKFGEPAPPTATLRTWTSKLIPLRTNEDLSDYFDDIATEAATKIHAFFAQSPDVLPYVFEVKWMKLRGHNLGMPCAYYQFTYAQRESPVQMPQTFESFAAAHDWSQRDIVRTESRIHSDVDESCADK